MQAAPSPRRRSYGHGPVVIYTVGVFHKGYRKQLLYPPWSPSLQSTCCIDAFTSWLHIYASSVLYGAASIDRCSLLTVRAGAQKLGDTLSVPREVSMQVAHRSPLSLTTRNTTTLPHPVVASRVQDLCCFNKQAKEGELPVGLYFRPSLVFHFRSTRDAPLRVRVPWQRRTCRTGQSHPLCLQVSPH